MKPKTTRRTEQEQEQKHRNTDKRASYKEDIANTKNYNQQKTINSQNLYLKTETIRQKVDNRKQKF